MMSAYNIQFHAKKEPFLDICFLSYWKNFVGAQNRVQISHGTKCKRAIRVRAIEIRLYTVKLQWLEHLWDRGNLFEIGVVRATEG